MKDVQYNLSHLTHETPSVDELDELPEQEKKKIEGKNELRVQSFNH